MLGTVRSGSVIFFLNNVASPESNLMTGSETWPGMNRPSGASNEPRKKTAHNSLRSKPLLKNLPMDKGQPLLQNQKLQPKSRTTVSLFHCQ
jgi:hypothetical protein